ncbi:MAG TPA: hypothetical protein VGA13_13870 [Acidimicrobiales bacterium]
MNELAAALRRQRSVLSHLLFKLVEAHRLLAAGETRFLTAAAHEVEQATARVLGVELERALTADQLWRDLGRAPSSADDLTLPLLIELAPAPYAGIFADHRTALLALVSEIHSTAHDSRRIATPGAPVSLDIDCNDPGTALDLVASEIGIDATVTAAAGLALASLVDFLG